MGRPKVKIIDDSAPEEVKTTSPKKLGRQDDSLVAKLKEELGIEATPKREFKPKGEVKPREVKAPSEVKTEEKKEEAPKTEAAPAPKKVAPKQVSKKYRSKAYKAKLEELDKEVAGEAQEGEEEVVKTFKGQAYKVVAAIEMVKKASYSSFDGTLEAHINTRTTGIRGLVSLPFAAGKQIKVIAFGNGAADSGADIVGDDAAIDEISKGKVNFDIMITTPEWMPKLAKVARNLGPKGLMPNPKNGTITEDLKKAVEGFKAGKTEYRTENKAQVIHLGLGKLSQPTEELEANVKMLLQTIGKSRIAKVTLAPTMGASVKIDLGSI